LEARAQIYGHATPLQPVLEFFRLLFQISPGDDSDLARRRITERVLAIAPTFEADLPVIFEFLGVASSESPPSLLQPKARRARLLDIVRHIVRQVGGETSVIIVEDLHWLDEASEDFVLTVVDAVAGTRASLILNYRPSYSAPWMTSSNFHEISLSELGPGETSGLVEELLGTRPELRNIRQQVAARSGGNPFFAEELVRSLVENGVLLGYAGVYSQGRRNGENSLPATVEAVIGARIDRLGESEKTVLQIGAIIGKEFPLVVLQQVIGRVAANVESVLSRLCEIEMLQDQTIADTRQYAFRHPLIQEVAYMTQLKARRSALHASVARAMKSYYWDRLDEFAGLIAHHHEAAGQLSDAANFSARAAKWVGSTAPAQAIKHWQKVRRLMQDQQRSHADDALRIMASSQIAWLGWREGMTAEEATPYLEEALRWARETDDTMVSMLLFVDGRITVASGGSADTYVDRVKEALSLVKKGHHAGRFATLNCALSQAYGWAGLMNEALIANDAAMEGVSDVEHFDHQFLGYRVDHWAVSLRGRILVRLGRFGEAEACFQDMLRIEDRLFDPTLQFIPHLGYVDLAWCRGDADLAKKHAARVAEIADKSGTAYLRVYAFACSGTAKGLAGDYPGAAQDFAEGLAFVETARASLGYEPELFASLADCHLQMSQPDLAVLAAKKAIDAARQRNTRLAECRASIICAAALVAEHGTIARSEAEELLKRAEALIERTGAVIYQPFLQRNRASALV
jgi:tetratricopeptide (TPR) repeat protein